MTRSLCEMLDAFSDGFLSPEESERFAKHLRQCPRCQSALAQQADFETALKQYAGTLTPPSRFVPPTVSKSPISTRRVSISLASLAASVALIAALSFSRAPRNRPHSVERPLPSMDRSSPVPDSATAAMPPKSAVESTSHLAVVDDDEEFTDVTFVMLYPWIEPKTPRPIEKEVKDETLLD